ncbi:phage tail protein [Staphylococcus americanisciuri]|uniref:Phage tail protein n=1 Tax=Staphylococcus americanisciuri TaxID=2973940 RepID=A0ABT2F454_9STAP|nr:phage tail protein [Staphylococcus americanisciuri]MCS4487187.1 phage tail protein [Staphylococcus americanisciuri]
MPILIKNRIGKGYPVYTSTVLTHKLSDDGSLTFDILENENTYDLISAIGKMWTVHNVEGADDKRVYVITIIDRQTRGEKQYVSVTARQKELDDLMVSRIISNVTGSFTVENYFKIVFDGSGYQFKLQGKASSSRWENAGDGDSRYEMFMNGLNRYGFEYTYDPSTKTFILEPFVEKTASYYLSNKVNANNLKLEEDASECYTFIRGYGGYDEGEPFTNGSVQIEFTHPLSKIIGKREAPPETDGKITHVETMKQRLETIINQSLKTSLSLDFIALRKHFPKAVPKIGDLVPVRDDILDIRDSVRIIEIKTVRDAHNEIIKQDVVLGDVRRRDRYIKRVNNAATLASGLGGGSEGVRAIRTVQQRVVAASQAVVDVSNTSASLEFDGLGIHGKSGKLAVSFMQDGIKSSNDGAQKYTTLINGNGFNMDAMPTATPLQKGLMSAQDKTKLDRLSDENFMTTEERTKLARLNANAKGLVLTGDNGKKYNLSVDANGQLIAREV